jgi:hypothetical protein
LLQRLEQLANQATFTNNGGSGSPVGDFELGTERLVVGQEVCDAINGHDG